jgi:hypothetical protein
MPEASLLIRRATWQLGSTNYNDGVYPIGIPLMLRWQNLPASALGGDLAVSWDVLNAARGDLPFLSA